MKVSVSEKNGNFFIDINGKVYPFVANRSFRPEKEVVKKFSDYGLKFFNIFPSGIMTALLKRTVPYSLFGPVWTGKGEYNWDNLRAQCDEIIGNIDENTYFSVNVHLDPPEWFVEQHPELRDHWEEMVQNLSHKEWKEEAANYLRALVKKLDEWFPERLYAIFLLSGGTTEWYSYRPLRVINDPSELQRQAYRDYCGDQNATLPTLQEVCSADDGFIRSRSKDSESIRYMKFINDSTVDTVLYFARVAKEVTGGSRLVGLFYGGVYGQNVDYGTWMGYNQLERMLESKDVDMLFCPASYICRKLESTSAWRMPVDSLSLSGKLCVHEIDSASYLLKKKADSAAVAHARGRDEEFTCPADNIMYIRREAGIAMAKGHGYWWFDMFSGSYDDPVMMESILEIKNVQEELLNRSSKSVAEAVMLIDQESSFYLCGDSFYPMVEHMLPELNSTAIPYDVGMTFDINKKGFHKDKYKLYMLPILFSPTPEIVDTLDGLRKKGKNILFFHAPYYALEDKLSIEPMTLHTGITFERCELVDNTVELCFEGGEGITYDFSDRAVPGDTWFHRRENDRPVTPIFAPTNLDIVLGRFRENGKAACGIKFRKDGGFDAFTACAPIPKELIAKIAEYAQIMRYCDRYTPIYTNEGFECVYSFEGGDITLYRPENCTLTDCFGGETYKVGKDGTKVHFEPKETKYFFVEKQHFFDIM